MGSLYLLQLSTSMFFAGWQSVLETFQENQIRGRREKGKLVYENIEFERRVDFGSAKITAAIFFEEKRIVFRFD